MDNVNYCAGKALENIPNQILGFYCVWTSKDSTEIFIKSEAIKHVSNLELPDEQLPIRGNEFVELITDMIYTEFSKIVNIGMQRGKSKIDLILLQMGEIERTLSTNE